MSLIPLILQKKKLLGSKLNYEHEVKNYFSELLIPLSTSQKKIINTLVYELKTGLNIQSLDECFDAIYLFANETGEAALRNLVKNDYHATKVGNPAINKFQGIKFNGTNYLNTNLNIGAAGINYNKDSASFGIYSILQVGGLWCDIGIELTNNAYSCLYASSNYLIAYYNNNSINNLALSENPDSFGHLVSSRTAANRVDYYINGVGSANSSQASEDVISANFYIGTLNSNNAPKNSSQRQYLFSHIGRGLSDSEVTVVKNAFDNYINSLNLRNRTKVLEKGSVYDGWAANALAAPSVCWDGTRYVMTLSLWSTANSKWASAFFTSQDLKTWTYVESSLLPPTGEDYIFANAGLEWWNNAYWFAVGHYPAVGSDRNIAIYNSTDLINWTLVVDPLLSDGFDPSLSVNPISNKLELWYCKGTLQRTLYMRDTADGSTWALEAQYMSDSESVGFVTSYGEPSVFYINGVRYITVDGRTGIKGRSLQMLHSVNNDTTWILDGTILRANTNAWESAQVFDSCVIIANLNDGLGNIPRLLYAGSDNKSATDGTNSSIGLFPIQLISI